MKPLFSDEPIHKNVKNLAQDRTVLDRENDVAETLTLIITIQLTMYLAKFILQF